MVDYIESPLDQIVAVHWASPPPTNGGPATHPCGQYDETTMLGPEAVPWATGNRLNPPIWIVAGDKYFVSVTGVTWPDPQHPTNGVGGIFTSRVTFTFTVNFVGRLHVGQNPGGVPVNSFQNLQMGWAYTSAETDPNFSPNFSPPYQIPTTPNLAESNSGDLVGDSSLTLRVTGTFDLTGLNRTAIIWFMEYGLAVSHDVNSVTEPAPPQGWAGYDYYGTERSLSITAVCTDTLPP
jgi:hypothetical protein